MTKLTKIGMCFLLLARFPNVDSELEIPDNIVKEPIAMEEDTTTECQIMEFFENISYFVYRFQRDLEVNFQNAQKNPLLKKAFKKKFVS